MYITGNYINVPCDRIPFPLTTCPVCGGGIKIGRAFTEINPLRMFGLHDSQVTVFEEDPAVTGSVTKFNCQDPIRPCWLCDPTEDPAFLMLVGEKFYPTPEDFMNEGVAQGVSKRIPFIPKNLQVGKTVIYLAHHKAVAVTEPALLQHAMNCMEAEETGQPRLLETGKVSMSLGIFTAFVAQKIEKLYWQSELDAMTDEHKADLAARGISPVGIPDGDKDHDPKN